jgi:hypothetical protein
VPSRNPQLRQNRSADGIGEWQFEQTIVDPEDTVFSEFCDMSNAYLLRSGAR